MPEYYYNHITLIAEGRYVPNKYFTYAPSVKAGIVFKDGLCSAEAQVVGSKIHAALRGIPSVAHHCPAIKSRVVAGDHGWRPVIGYHFCPVIKVSDYNILRPRRGENSLPAGRIRPRSSMDRVPDFEYLTIDYPPPVLVKHSYLPYIWRLTNG